MEQLIHADIFFFVATIATGLVAVVLAIALYFVIGILRDIKHLTQTSKEVTFSVGQYFANLDAKPAHGLALEGLAFLFHKLGGSKSSRSKRK